MPGIHQQLTDDPVSCEVVEPVLGGQFVETRAASAGATQRCVGVAGAASATVVGVALIDAAPVAAQANPLLIASYPVATAVAIQGEVNVTYAANATYGARLKVAAAGQVTPWISGTDNPSLIVGYCAVPGGVASAAVGVVRLLNLC